MSGLLLTLAALGCGGREDPTRSANEGELFVTRSAEEAGGPEGLLDFGEAQLGARTSRSFEAYNAGADPIQVRAIRFSESTDASFFLSAPRVPIDLASGERFSVQVTFAPGKAETSSTTLYLDATGRTSGARMRLTGAGTP